MLLVGKVTYVSEDPTTARYKRLGDDAMFQIEDGSQKTLISSPPALVPHDLLNKYVCVRVYLWQLHTSQPPNDFFADRYRVIGDSPIQIVDESLAHSLGVLL